MKHELRITLLVVAFFFAAQIIGLGIVNSYVEVKKEIKIVDNQTVEVINRSFEALPYNIERPKVEENKSFIFIFTAIIIGTLLLLLFMKLGWHIVWKIWFFIAVFLSLVIAFAAFINDAIAVFFGLALSIWKVFGRNIYAQNFTELFIYGGLAAIFSPIMNITAAIILLILIAGYDIYAVYKSKHMIDLAKFQTKEKLFAGFRLPYTIKEKLQKRETRKLIKPEEGKVVKIRAKQRLAVLGGGDMAFPLLFAGVVLKNYGLLKTLIIPVFATVGLGYLLYKGKAGKFYPAMPFIAAGCFIGYGIIILINIL